MDVASITAFDSAEREYNDAWNAPRARGSSFRRWMSTGRSRTATASVPTRGPTRAMIWDMDTRKAWDPLTYIPYVVSPGPFMGPNDPA
jgi:hypothetical protein